MIQVRKASERGQSNLSWLKSFHSFSFGDYYDPNYRGFGSLRVINEDFIDEDKGFGEHPHQDMEIITYMVSGEIEHRDSLGNHFVLKPGEVQRMSAGTGIVHSEINPSKKDKTHLLQIWIYPREKGLVPSYEQTPISKAAKANKLTLIGGPNKPADGVTIHQDANLYVAELGAGKSVIHQMESTRQLWVQVVSGELSLNEEHELSAGDGASVSKETLLTFKSKNPCEFLLFDMA